MKEIWKDIDYTNGNYQVSNLGRVKHKARFTKNDVYIDERILKPMLDKYGYCVVHISNYPKQTILIHRLVANAFIPNPLNKIEVNHKDGNKLNNCVDNLEWVTRSENVRHAINTGLMVLHKMPIVCIDNTNIIEYESLREAERKTGFCRKSIVRAINRKWKYKGYYWKYKEKEE